MVKKADDFHHLLWITFSHGSKLERMNEAVRLPNNTEIAHL